jgi:hypothetical protein
MKKEYRPLNEYLIKLINFNAKERLSLITKNAEVPLDKSSSWKYNPNLEVIISNEKKYYNLEEKYNKKFEFNPIDSKYYYPKFIKDMNEQQMKDFSNKLSNKIRRVKLTMAKLQLDSERFKDYEKEEKKKIRNISFKNEIKKLFGKTMVKKGLNSPKLEKLNAERAYNFGIVKTYKNIRERFDNYKSDFNMRLNDLENAFEAKLFNKFIYTQKNNNSSKKKSNSKDKKSKSHKKDDNMVNMKKVLEEHKTKTSNDNLLPTIHTTRSVLRKKENEHSVRSKKSVDFMLKKDGYLTQRNQKDTKTIEY